MKSKQLFLASLFLSCGILLHGQFYTWSEDIAPIMRELSRVTSGGGSIIVTTPNGSNRSRELDGVVNRSAGFIKTLVGLNGKRGRSAHTMASVEDPRIKHRRFTAAELAVAGRPNGLILVEKRFVSLYLVPVVLPWIETISDKLHMTLIRVSE